MESAPKDGTRILVSGGTYKYTGVMTIGKGPYDAGRKPRTVWWQEGAWRCNLGFDREDQPKYWIMPLPEPPQ